MARQYKYFIAKIGPYTIKYKLSNLRDVRFDVRKRLDKLEIAYASLSGYDSKGNVIIITGVRDSAHKQFPVASATRG